MIRRVPPSEANGCVVSCWRVLGMETAIRLCGTASESNRRWGTRALQTDALDTDESQNCDISLTFVPMQRRLFSQASQIRFNRGAVSRRIVLREPVVQLPSAAGVSQSITAANRLGSPTTC